MKKFVSIVLTLVLVLGIAIPASASQITIGTIETEEQKLARVQAEVLSGNITNDQDVIEVALEQLAEKVAYCRENGIEMNPNESLTITQVIESDASIAGVNSTRDVSVTGLFMFDDNGVQITADYVNRFGSDSVDILNGNIHATTTMVVRERPQQFTIETKVYNIYTIFQNVGGYTADRLQHRYTLMPAFEDIQESGVIYDPANNTSYTFHPSTDYIANAGAAGAGYYLGEAEIIKNGTTYRNHIRYYVFTKTFECP